MANKFRLKGKFVSEAAYNAATFKPLLKEYGLDSVSYSDLTAQQKRIYNGVKNAANKITAPNGRFVDNSILRTDIIKGVAKDLGLTPKEYFDKNKDKLTQGIFKKGLPISRNSFKMADFVEKHNGKFTYKGKPISKKQLLYKIAQKEQGHKTKAKKATESEDSEDSDTDFILVYKMKHNIFTNEIDLTDIDSLKDLRE